MANKTSQPSKEIGAFSVLLETLPKAGQAAYEFEGLLQRSHWAVLAVSITDFASFVTAYGEARGDELLGFLTDTLFKARTAVGQPGDFLAYLGAPDFLIITAPEAAPRLQDEIFRLFDAGLSSFYSPEDLARGFLEIDSGCGKFQRFPLVSLAFGLVTDKDGPFTKRLEIFDALTGTRRKAEREMLSLELGSLRARRSYLKERLKVLESDVKLAGLIDEFAWLSTGTIHDLRNGLNILYQDVRDIPPQGVVFLADDLHCSRILLENLSEIRFKGVYSPKALQLPLLLSEVQRLLNSKGDTSAIRILRDTDPLPAIYADETQLQQALVSLLKWLSERLDVSSEIAVSACAEADCVIIEVNIETWPEEWSSAPDWPVRYLRVRRDPRPYVVYKIWRRHGGAILARPETKRITFKLPVYQLEDLVSTAEMQRQIAMLRKEVQPLEQKVNTLEKISKESPLSVDKAASLGASTARKLSRELEIFRCEAEQVLSPVGKPAHPLWKTIVRNCDYCQLLVMNLLALGQGEDKVFGPIAMASILEDVSAILANKTRPLAKLEWDIEPALDLARGEETGLKQIFMNLIINALEAVSSRPDLPGLIKISARNVAEWVQVEITDNGCGISPADLEKIFDLHFTTKRQRDRGIGLYIVKSVVERLGGHTEIQSQEGVGTTAFVRLPRWG
jgi:signal transduction histidine kinase